MSDGVAGVVEWGLELFEGVKKELGKVCAPVEEGFKGVGSLNSGLPHPSDPDVKIHHTEQNEERKRAMARYGEYLLIRQKNVAKVARLGAELVARREQGFSQDSKGTREVLDDLAEVREKAERDEKRLKYHEEKAYETRYTGSATFTGDTFGKGSSRKGDASAHEHAGRDVSRGRAVVPGSGSSTRSSSAASGHSQRSRGSHSSGKSAPSTNSKGSGNEDGGGSRSQDRAQRSRAMPGVRAPVVDHVSSGARNLDAPPID